MNNRLTAVLAALAGTLVLCSSAQAQWQWRDANGRMVISDQAPPPEVPERSIIKGPGFRPLDAAQVKELTQQKNSTGDRRPAAPNTPSMADREKDFQKRQQEAADTAKKAADSAAKSAETQALCSRMRGSLVALENGRRIMQTDESGESRVMEDQQREEESNRLRKQISEQCSG